MLFRDKKYFYCKFFTFSVGATTKTGFEENPTNVICGPRSGDKFSIGITVVRCFEYPCPIEYCKSEEFTVEVLLISEQQSEDIQDDKTTTEDQGGIITGGTNEEQMDDTTEDEETETSTGGETSTGEEPTIGGTTVPMRPFVLSSVLDGNSYRIVGQTDTVTPLSFSITANEFVQIDLAGTQSGTVQVTLPNKMINNIYGIETDSGQNILFNQIAQSSTSNTILFTVPPGTSSVQIMDAMVVPEFPFAIIILATVMIFAVIFTRSKFNLIQH